MRRSVIEVVNDSIPSSSEVYSAAQFNEVLGSCDQVALHAVCDQITSSSPTISVRLHQSGDNRNFEAKTGSAIIASVSLTAGATSNAFGADAGTTPNQGFIRLAITLGGTGTVSGHVRIYATLRDQRS